MYNYDSRMHLNFVCDDDYVIDRTQRVDGDDPFDESLCLSTSKEISITNYMVNSKKEVKRIYKRLDREWLGSIKIKFCK